MAKGTHVLRGQDDKPLGLYLAGLLLLLFGIPQALFFALLILEAVVGPSSGTFGALGAEDLTAAEFLILSPVVALTVASQLALGYGLVVGRAWARPLGVFLWLGLGIVIGGTQLLGSSGFAAFRVSLLVGLIVSIVAYWYMYRAHRIVRYYEGLGRSSV